MRAGYREVVRPERLVWTEPDVEGGTTTTITLTDLGDGRTEVVTQTNVPPPMTTRNARRGFETSLRRFADYLGALAA
jgi:uncharacterized protein YndB with AHSA1/START domain